MAIYGKIHLVAPVDVNVFSSTDAVQLSKYPCVPFVLTSTLLSCMSEKST